VGADVVEVSPPYDGPGQITSLLAANLMFELVSVLALGDEPSCVKPEAPRLRRGASERWGVWGPYRDRHDD